MLFPKYILEDLSVGSGSIIGKSNIEEFFNHISIHKDVVIEARKVLKRFNKLGSPISVISTHDEEAKIPIPCKLLGLSEAFENNFDWICPENLFDESSVPKNDHKGSSKTYVDEIQCLIDKTSAVDLNASSDIT